MILVISTYDNSQKIDKWSSSHNYPVW